MARILQIFVRLCLLRANPQDLPHSHALELITVVAYAAMSYLLGLTNMASPTALLAALVDTAMLVGLAYAGLWVLNLTARRVKLVTALAGTGVVWQLVALPVMSLLVTESSADDASFSAQIASTLLLALIAWAVVIIGHILRHAFGMKFFFALVIAVLYVYTSMRVGSAIFIASQ